MLGKLCTCTAHGMPSEILLGKGRGSSCSARCDAMFMAPAVTGLPYLHGTSPEGAAASHGVALHPAQTQSSCSNRSWHLPAAFCSIVWCSAPLKYQESKAAQVLFILLEWCKLFSSAALQGLFMSVVLCDECTDGFLSWMLCAEPLNT